MATVELRYSPQNTAWFTTNAAMILKAGEPAYHETTGLFKLGDGVTALSALTFLPTVTPTTPTLQQVLTAGQVATTTIETTGFIKTGGTSSQFLKADGTIDSSTYLTSLGTAATSLTVTGSSGASTLIGNVLNVPTYTLSGLGGQPLDADLTSWAAITRAANFDTFVTTPSSLNLLNLLTDKTGTGVNVFGTSPTFITQITTPRVSLVNGAITGFVLNDGTSLAIGSSTATDVEFYYNDLLKLKILANEFRFTDSVNLYFATTNGTKIGVTTSQKLAFWGLTPIIQPANTVSINDLLVNTGLRATGGTSLFTNTVTINNPSASSQIDFVKNTVSAFFLNDGSSFAFGTGSAHKTEVYYNNVLNYRLGPNFELTDGVNIQIATTTGSKIGTATTQKIGFWNATPIVQPLNTVAIDDVLINTGLWASGATNALFTKPILARISPRVTTIVSSATPTININNCESVTITALATNITSFTTNLSGTPVNFDKLTIRIKDDGTIRTLAWGASFVAKGTTLPTTTVANKLLTVIFIYDSVALSWGCVGSSQEI